MKPHHHFSRAYKAMVGYLNATTNISDNHTLAEADEMVKMSLIDWYANFTGIHNLEKTD